MRQHLNFVCSMDNDRCKDIIYTYIYITRPGLVEFTARAVKATT